MSVEPRRYRFRFLNASNARFFIMQLFNQQGVDMHVNGAGRAGDLADRVRRRLPRQPGQARRPRRGNQQCAGSPIGNNIGDTPRPAGRVPVPGARRAHRRDHRLLRPGRQDLHAQELRGHPVPQRRPGRLWRARRDVGRARHAVQREPAAAGDGHVLQPGRHAPGAARGAHRQHQAASTPNELDS